MKSTLRVVLWSISSIGLLCGAAHAAPPITWEPGALELEIGSGPAQPVEVTFHATEAVENVTAEVVPELAPFVSISNPTIVQVEAGVPSDN